MVEIDEDKLIHGAVVLIEFGRSLLVVIGCVLGSVALARRRGSHSSKVRARLLVADSLNETLPSKRLRRC